MAKFDILKKTKELGKDLVDKLPEGMSTDNLKSSMKNLVDLGTDTIANMKKRSEENAKAIKESLARDKKELNNVTNEDALKIIYCIMAADGKIDEEETIKFIEIANEVDNGFNTYQDNLMLEMKDMIIKAKKDEDYDLCLSDFISETIRHSKKDKSASIPSKLLIWNLLVIAYSDGTCNEEELKLIRYTAKQLELDRSIILEFTSYIQTLMAMMKEEEWLKSSNRKYTEVEKVLNELTDRKQNIMQGVYALIKD